MYLIPQNRNVMPVAIYTSPGSQQIIRKLLTPQDDESLSQRRNLIDGSILIGPDFQLLPRVHGGELERVTDEGQAWGPGEGDGAAGKRAVEELA